MIEESFKVLKSLNYKGETELIVIDDGSTDRTVEIVENAMKYYPFLRLVRHEHNRGYAEVIRTGLREATAEFIVWIDADLQNDPRDIPLLLTYMRDNVGVAIGWRKHRKDSLFRRVISKIYNRILIRILFGLNYNDLNGKPKVLRRKLVSQIELTSNGWMIDAELVKKAEERGFLVVEIAVRHAGRQLGKSKLSIRSLFKTQKYMLEYFLNQRKQKQT